ncbi:hypothetical protein SAMN04488243_10335 [Thermus arciformis]|uniref:FeoC like transcriptional regulator n=1 Tax=Thermus arciformis TaxID=482827 RepID=A0A1G7DLL8_9DEIN|nr:hypothetical protein [Thermus arciformis]SDE52363.1 hypothetical protein SAMN04488243_10335 [Thermus arciformis]
MIQEALALLATPKTPSELARALGLRPETAELLLRHLEAKGYARPLNCGTACGRCAFKELCGDPAKVHWVRAP